ncbi:MAG: 4Fe-4S dicluster domain-containing protein [Thermoplasmatota archaeon]
MKAMSKERWLEFVNRLIKDDDREVIGVRAKGSKFVFGHLDDARELRLDYDVTVLPPKKQLLPPHEELLTYDISKPFDVLRKMDSSGKILLGVHPYDVLAIHQMDEVYLGTHTDDHYDTRRKNTLIIASDILKVSDRAFSGSLDTHIIESGFDLLVTDIGSSIVITIGSEKGQELLDRYAEVREANPKEIDAVRDLREKLPGKYKRKLKVDKYQWEKLLSENYEHPIWEENSKKCLTCGSCTLVCPTCFCYDVRDDMEINLKEGKRVRTWDGCLLREFTAVAGGEVFRESVKERYRHRYYRKGMYLPMRNGFVACVGCGRCATQCLPDIADPLEVMNVLASYSMNERTRIPIPDVKQKGITDDLLIPQPATIVRKEKQTELETLYELKLDSGKELGHRPGQFVEVSIFGVGEAPISVSSSPGGETFELLVRRIGDLTSKLESMKIGDKVGIRGPFGNGFDVKQLEGKDLLFISGGCGLAPTRSLIEYVFEHRGDFGKVTILYGCKEPNAILFNDDLNRWHKQLDTVLKTTVDSCPDGQCWNGNIGVITTLIPQIEFDPKKTISIIVGPPVMYKFVIRDLKSRNVPDENIIVSLERRMKCGVGKCGHCQMNGIYVCLEGPVFNFKDVKDVPEAF